MMINHEYTHEDADATFRLLDANPENIIADADYVPEGEGEAYIAYLRDAADFLTARGMTEAAQHFRGRLELAERGYTLARAQTLML